MADDLWERIRSLEEDLLAEEEEEWDEECDPDEEYDDGYVEEEILRPGRNFAVDFGRTRYADEDDEDMEYVEPVKKKGIKGLVFLAILEVLGILAIIGWWLRWLI